jgi:hypothetical protein
MVERLLLDNQPLDSLRHQLSAGVAMRGGFQAGPWSPNIRSFGDRSQGPPDRQRSADDLKVSRPRQTVVWSMRIGVLTFATNAVSLIAFWSWTESLVILPLLLLLPCSVVLGVIVLATYRRECIAVSRSSTLPKRWAVMLNFSLSIALCALVILAISLYHGASLGNLDPGGF